jgi:hypothetical protein
MMTMMMVVVVVVVVMKIKIKNFKVRQNITSGKCVILNYVLSERDYWHMILWKKSGKLRDSFLELCAFCLNWEMNATNTVKWWSTTVQLTQQIILQKQNSETTFQKITLLGSLCCTDIIWKPLVSRIVCSGLLIYIYIYICM